MNDVPKEFGIMQRIHNARPGRLNLLAMMRTGEGNRAVSEASAGIPRVSVDVRIGGVRDIAAELVEGRMPDLVLADIDLNSSAEIAALGRLVQEHARAIPVVATSADASVEGVRQLLRLGVSDFLPQPVSRTDLLAALEAAVTRPREGGKSGRRGRIIAFLKPCGGMGATTIAVQAAHHIAAAGAKGGKPRVCVIDLDLQYGNAAVMLDLAEALTIEEVLEAPERLDGAFLQGILAHHKNGVDVLPAPRDLVSLDALSGELAGRLLSVAAAEYGHVLVDLPQVYNEFTEATLETSDRIVLVTQLTVPAIRQARRQLDHLREQGIEAEAISVLVNRFERRWWRRSFAVREAEQALGRPIGHFVAGDFRLVSEALNHGVPLSEIKARSRVDRDIKAFAKSLVEGMRQEPAVMQPALLAEGGAAR